VYKILSKLVAECWRYSKPKQSHFWAWLKIPIFGVHDSQGSAETLVRRGGITNYHLIAYSFSNISAKNYQNRLMCIEVIVCNVSVVFWDTVYFQMPLRRMKMVWPIFALYRYNVVPTSLVISGLLDQTSSHNVAGSSPLSMHAFRWRYSSSLLNASAKTKGCINRARQ